MKEIVVGALLLAAIAFAVFNRPKTYRDLYPMLVMLIGCAAAFLAGLHSGGEAAHSELMPLIADEDLYLAAQLGGSGIPLFEVLVVCTLAVVFLLVLRLLHQIVEDNED